MASTKTLFLNMILLTTPFLKPKKIPLESHLSTGHMPNAYKPSEVLYKSKKRYNNNKRNNVARKELANRSQRRKIQSRKYAIIHLTSSLNNNIATLTTSNGKVLGWASSGSVGFVGAKRSTSFAAQCVGSVIASKALALGFRKVQVWSKGFGYGRGSALKGMRKKGLKVTLLKNVTPIPFNGCRPKKPRRM